MECELNKGKFRTLKVTLIIMGSGLERKDTERVSRYGMMVHYMRVNGIMIKLAERVDSFMQTGMFTKEAGLMTKLTVMVFIPTLMEQTT